MIVERRGDELVLIVEDDGTGMRPPEKSRVVSGFGMTGMRERASLLGGTLSIESSAGRGTAIFVTIPLVDHEQSTQATAR